MNTDILPDSLQIVTINIYNQFKSVISNFINDNVFTFLKNRTYINYIILFITIITLLMCFILILLNSFEGITQIITRFFSLDQFQYIQLIKTNFKDNFSKYYLPEFIISCVGLFVLICIAIYIRAYKKLNLSIN
tara:strand:- start:2161 stop:2562 length:402 start_codon:yes stop_codon:yes gene_type:complete